MNKLFIFIIRQLNPLWKNLGADPKAMALILDTKLKMDDRGGYVMGQRKAPKSGMEFLVFFFMFCFGCITIGAFFMLPYPADAVGVIFSFWLIYIGLLLVTEMSKNLLDSRDLYLLLTRPITDTTLSLARTLHIGVFTSKFALCMGLPVFVFMLFYYNTWSAISFFLAGIATVVITLVSTLLCYMLLLRFAPAHKVRRWVGYLQILLSTIFFALYQLPNFLDNLDFGPDGFTAQIVGSGWGYLFPGLWAGGLWSSLNGELTNTHTILQATLTLIAAIGGLIFYVRQSEGYGQRLLDMERSGSAPVIDDIGKPTPKSTWFSPRTWIGHALTRKGLERASFNFHWRMMQRDLDFKQRTWPSIVFYPIAIAAFVGKRLFDGSQAVDLAYTNKRGAVIMIIYALIMLAIAPIQNTKSSKHYKASWIFLATPNKQVGPIQYGQLLAILGAFFMPIALITYLAILLIWGLPALLDITFAAGISLLICIIMINMDKAAPFSRSVDGDNMDAFGAVILCFVLTPIFGFAHYYAGKLLWIIEVATVLVWLLNLYLLRLLRKK